MSRIRSVTVLACALVGLGGCVETALRERMEPFDYRPVPTAKTPAPTEGAIWPGAQQSGSFLFYDQKANQIGDLLTVVISENLTALGEAKTDLTKDSTVESKVTSDVGFQNVVATLAEKVLSLLGVEDEGGEAAAGTELTVLESDYGTSFSGEGTTERKSNFSGVIACRVLDVLPGDVYHIRGRRSIVVNHEDQWITLEGLVRREDITINNKIMSTDIAELRLTYDGIGVIDDKQRPGILARVLDWIYPF